MQATSDNAIYDNRILYYSFRDASRDLCRLSLDGILSPVKVSIQTMDNGSIVLWAISDCDGHYVRITGELQ